MLDRAAARRHDDEWLAQAWRSGRVLVIDADRRALVGDDGDLVLVDAASVEPTPGYFLGVDGDGTAYWGVVGELTRRLGTRPATLRDVGAFLADRDSELFTTTCALANWHDTHGRCPRCGTATVPVQAGWVRECPADTSQHFPRTDPAIIVLVHDGGDRCLLGRQPTWPPRRYSTLAGFVEPGESAEHAVRREVLEESGVAVRDVVYRTSQPWPFPSSLMLGFEGVAEHTEARVGDDELEDVGWFTRNELRDGTVLLPPPASIAHWLVRGWLDRPSPARA